MQALDDEEDVVIAEAVRFLSSVVTSRQLRRRALLRVVTRVSAYNSLYPCWRYGLLLQLRLIWTGVDRILDALRNSVLS